jgi:hypothetical protein
MLATLRVAASVALAAGSVAVVVTRPVGVDAGRPDTPGLGRANGTFRGLFLRTHPDHDKAPFVVSLLHADEVVLDDGTAVADWNRLEADIRAAGSGGLDSGAKAPNTWYEIHAVRKRSDDVRSLLLHRAREYELDQRQLSGAARERLRDAGIRTRLAQGFQIKTAGPTEFADVLISRSGAPRGSIWLSIEADDGSGSPGGQVLATSDKLDAAVLPQQAGLIRFIFRSPPLLESATPYHLVLSADFARSPANGIIWSGAAQDVYRAGVARQSDGSSWRRTAVVRDFAFRLFVTKEGPVVLPPGFDQQTKIGYVRTGPSGELNGFVARDRRVMPLTGSGTSGFSNVVPVLFDLSGSIPPGPIRVELTGANEIVGMRVAAQPVPMGFDARATNFSRDEGGHTSALISVPSQEQSVMLGSVVTEYQACYFFTTGGVGRSTVSSWEW